MNIIYQKYQITSPYDMIMIVKYINGYAQYFTETGEMLDETIGWSGIMIEDNIPTPDWD
jgi:hypothetical protein